MNDKFKHQLSGYFWYLISAKRSEASIIFPDKKAFYIINSFEELNLLLTDDTSGVVRIALEPLTMPMKFPTRYIDEVQTINTDLSWRFVLAFTEMYENFTGGKGLAFVAQSNFKTFHFFGEDMFEIRSTLMLTEGQLRKSWNDV